MEAQESSRIATLASIVATNTAKYDDYLSSHNLPSPSFDKETPFRLELPDEITQAHGAVLEASAELQALMLGPLGLLQDQTSRHTSLIALQAIYRFGMAMSFSVEQEASYEQISHACGLNQADVRRIIRYAMTLHIFKESDTGLVSHTAASRVLAEMPIMREWVGMICEEMWPSATRTVDAMVKWPGSQEPNHTGFAIANQTEDTVFSELSKHSTRAERFANAMSMFSVGDGFETYHLVDAYPWGTMNAKVFVDVGGSHGTASVALAQHLKSIHCIVQDRPEVVAEGSSKVPAELTDRITFMAHDFFSEQPIKGADVYFLRWILHDWSDKYCIKILRCLIPALKVGARIIVSEFNVPPPGVVPRIQERRVRSFDLAMLEMFNSKEREADDWLSLFQSADARFKFVDIKRPPNSKLSFIEVVWEGDGTS